MTHFNVIIGLKRFHFVSYKNIIWHEEKCDIQKKLIVYVRTNTTSSVLGVSLNRQKLHSFHIRL